MIYEDTWGTDDLRDSTSGRHCTVPESKLGVCEESREGTWSTVGGSQSSWDSVHLAGLLRKSWMR